MTLDAEALPPLPTVLHCKPDYCYVMTQGELP